MKTRSKPQKPAAPGDPETKAIATAAPLFPSVENPPKPFILPRNLSPEARIITLSNPVTSVPNRYLFCPSKGFYEFTKIAAPQKTPRSWLFTPNTPGTPETQEGGPQHVADGENEEDMSPFSKGYVTRSADLMIATPMDPLFLVLPAIAPAVKNKSVQKQMFLSLDDHLDKIGESSRHIKQLLRIPKARDTIEGRLGAVCDNVDAGVEQMYRLSSEKLLEELISKAQRVTKNGLPPSLEDKFVRTALQVPVLSVKREASFISAEASQGDSQVDTEGTRTPSEVATDSQQSIGSAVTAATDITVPSVDDTTTVEGKQPGIEAPDVVIDLLRLRTAFTFILSSYIPQHLHASLHEALAGQSAIDFAPLDTHLKRLAGLREQAQALRSISDNISRKRPAADDDEAADLRAEKKRKKEEEDKRKKNESHGVKQLKKVNTTGMKKLSSFFTKAPAKK